MPNFQHRFERQPLTITLGHEDYSIGAGGGDDDDRGDDFQASGADAAADTVAQAAADKIAADAQKLADETAAAAAKAGEGKTADELAAEAETEEEKAEREAEEAAQASKKRARIPLDRHEKIVEAARTREQQLQQRIAEMERAKGEQAPAQRRDALAEMKTQIETLQDKYEAHLFAGEKDEAKGVRRELDTLRESYTDQKVAASSNATRAQTIDTLKFEAALAKVEGDFPTLNPDGPDFEEARADEVAEMMSMYVGNGMTRQAALEKSVRYVMGTPATKREAGKDTAAETLRVAREKAAREKAAEANKQQPASTTGAGSDNDKGGDRDGAIDVMKLSQEKFAKIDEDMLSRMRGDTM